MSTQLDKDLYYLRIAKEVSKNSKCLSRKIGSVLVKDNSIISTGYNGPAKGVKHCSERNLEFFNKLNGMTKDVRETDFPLECPRRIFDYQSGQGLHLCQAGHSERNAIIQAARNGISTKDTTLYCFCGIPCKDCAIEIVNSGIKEIVCIEKSQNYDNYAETILKEGGVIIRPIKEELI